MPLKWEVESVQDYGLFPLKEMNTISAENLSRRNFSIIDDSKLSALFQQAKYDKRWSLWKGGSLAIVKLKDQTEIKIAISNYGGYFHIVGKQGYYYFEGKERDLWESLFFKKSVDGNSNDSSTRQQ